MELRELETYLNDLLRIREVVDYCPNGLQVQGRHIVKKLVTGVTACQGLLEAAVAAEADAILVHHGFFWKGESHRVVSMKQRRLKTLLTNDISLLAYHLPLDMHPVYGNNVTLANLLNIAVTGNFMIDNMPLGFTGDLPHRVTGEEFAKVLSEKLNREPLHIAGNDRRIKKVAWCTGGGQRYIREATKLGVDAYITGEVSESTVHVARECGMHFYSAGHHATERYGVQAVGEHLADQFNITHEFIDIDNPV